MNKRDKEYRERISSMSNAELWEEFLETQQPDDYDGGFTTEGSERFIAAQQEMEKRLADWIKS